MVQIVLTVLIILIPFLLVLFLRTNAAILFFVLCGASTLQAYLDKDVSGFMTALLPGKNTEVVSLVLFVLPFLVAAFAFRQSVMKSQLLFHLVLALLVGCSLVFVGPQFMPDSVVETIRESSPYEALQPFSSLVIASAFLMSTVFLWLAHPHAHHDKKH